MIPEDLLGKTFYMDPFIMFTVKGWGDDQKVVCDVVDLWTMEAAQQKVPLDFLLRAVERGIVYEI